MKLLLKLAMGLVLGWVVMTQNARSHLTPEKEKGPLNKYRTSLTPPEGNDNTIEEENAQAQAIIDSIQNEMGNILQYTGSIDRLIEENTKILPENPDLSELFGQDQSWRIIKNNFIGRTDEIRRNLHTHLTSSQYIIQTFRPFVVEVEELSKKLKRILTFLWDKAHTKPQSILETFHQEAQEKLEEPYKKDEFCIQKEIFNLLTGQIDLKIPKNSQKQWLSQNFLDSGKVKKLYEKHLQNPNQGTQQKINAISSINTHYAEILLSLL